MYLIGLTGGIGSGKSTVASRLAMHGCDLVDADAVAREVVAPGEPVLADLAERFGDDLLRADGTLDRAALAARAFVDDQARADLDRITHPRIAGRIAERVATIGLDAPADHLVVVDHPLLLETEQATRFDAVLVVLADAQTRVRRLVEDRGLDEQDVRARMRAQVSDAERERAATHVIVNDGTVAELEREVDRVHAQLREAAAAR